MAAYYDRLAQVYDDGEYFRAQHAAVLTAIAAEFEDARAVLDLGCGNGAYAPAPILTDRCVTATSYLPKRFPAVPWPGYLHAFARLAASAWLSLITFFATAQLAARAEADQGSGADDLDLGQTGGADKPPVKCRWARHHLDLLPQSSPHLRRRSRSRRTFLTADASGHLRCS